MSERWMIEVTVDPAPEGDGPEFDVWCERHGFDPLNGGRRAWCSALGTYLRDAYGVADCDGEEFLVWSDDLLPLDDGRQA